MPNTTMAMEKLNPNGMNKDGMNGMKVETRKDLIFFIKNANQLDYGNNILNVPCLCCQI